MNIAITLIQMLIFLKFNVVILQEMHIPLKTLVERKQPAKGWAETQAVKTAAKSSPSLSPHTFQGQDYELCSQALAY